MKLHVWIASLVACFTYILSTCSAQQFYVAAPNTIRLGVDETIALAVDGTTTSQMVDVYIHDHPGKTKIITQNALTLRPNEPEIMKIRLEAEDLPDLVLTDPNIKNYVKLVVKSGAFVKEVAIPISSKSGYVFVQTDKPIYSPKQRVSIRIIPLNEDVKPSENEFRLQIRNPKNVIVEENIFNGKNIPKQGRKFFVSHVYQFPAYPLFGEWSAIASYGYQFQQNSSVKFELQEYVLPTFTVKLTTQEVILPTANAIRASVEAKYVYGKPVEGIVTFRFGVKGAAPEALFFAVLASMKLDGGTYDLQVDTDELKQNKDIGWFPQIEGSHFVIEATVRDSASGNTEVTTDAKGRFSTSPFVISFKRCLGDFKPGLISVIEADVNYVDGRPASGISTVITAIADNNNKALKISNPNSLSDDEGRVSFEIHPEMNHNTVTVTVSTNDEKFAGSQATGRKTQLKFKSTNRAYIAITRRSGKTLAPATMFAEDIHIEPADISDVYYLVVSKGKIMKIGKLPHGKFKIQRVEFMVTYDMAPSFRLVVFANYKNELIADSLKVDVGNKCNPKADVLLNPEFKLKEPGKAGKIHISGTKSTLVGLLAVDEAVYALSDKDLLTKSKMFNVMKTHDLGCGPGGGLTSSNVLGNAGVVIMTSSSPKDQTSVSTCDEKVRRKRDVLFTKLKTFSGRHRYCCKLGMEADHHDRPCEERSKLIANYLEKEDYNCSQVFLDCCLFMHAEGITAMKLTGMIRGLLGRIGNDGSDVGFIPPDQEHDFEKDLTVRSDFRETWIFEDITIGLDNKEEYLVSLPHSITTWVIQAVAVSEEYGMCVVTPQRLESFKKVFLQLNLPYSVVRNEQIEIQATLFNYGDSSLSAVLFMYGVKDLCTGTQEGEKSERKRLVVEPYSAQTVTFPVIPLKEGVYDIKVTALSMEGGDIIIRKLNVVSEGHTVEDVIPLMLDPSNQQKRSKRHIIADSYSDSIDESQNLQVTAINLKAPDGYIPGTESCVISALGDQFGPTVETSLDDPDKLILKPHGCGEQNMIYLGPTLYTMRYLKVTGKITPEKEAVGYDYIRHGYGNQLTFRKNDGSFGAWIHTPSSVWLTAFVTKVFCQASRMVHIEEAIMCSGVEWLVKTQQPDGSFVDNHPIYHKEMMGGVKGQSPLTAFILITLQECTCNDQNLHLPKARAVAYLEEHLGDVVEPLPVAVVAYALALSDSDFKQAANDKLLALAKYDRDQNTLHWGVGNSASNVETTSYALLTQLLFNDMVKGNSIVNWLNTQRLPAGAFHSTQDTVMALQAMSEYAIRAKAPGINLISNITASNDRNFQATMAFHENNALVLQEVRLNKLGGMLFVNTAGHGVGLLSVKLRYNVPYPADKLCRFEIKVNVTEENEEEQFDDDDDDDGNPNLDPRGKDTFIFLPDDRIRGVPNLLNAEPDERAKYNVDPRNRQQRNSRIGRPARVKRQDHNENSNLVYNVQICVKYLGNQETGMSIVDAGIFSGFEPNENDLKSLQKSAVHQIQRYERSSRGIVFYLEKIPVQNPYCFSFRIKREYIVGNTQTSVIQVYDYYNPDETCTTFYSPSQNSPMLRKICNNGICQCAEGGCPPTKPFAEVRDLSRKNMKARLIWIACEKHDYVWLGSLEGPIEKKDGFLNINFKVDEVIKEGKEKAAFVEGLTRLILARDSCDSATLFPNKRYLIMGKDGEKYEGKDGTILHRYLLDKSASIHLWNEDPPKNNHFERAMGKMRDDLKEKGCNT